MFVAYETGLYLKHSHLIGKKRDPLVTFVTNQILVAVAFVSMMISTVWVNRRCERIIESNRVQGIRRMGSQFSFEIAPKPQKVNNQITKKHMKISDSSNNRQRDSTRTWSRRRSLEQCRRMISAFICSWCL